MDSTNVTDQVFGGTAATCSFGVFTGLPLDCVPIQADSPTVTVKQNNEIQRMNNSIIYVQGVPLTPSDVLTVFVDVATHLLQAPSQLHQPRNIGVTIL